ncbi:LysR family transcriptional regulator [Pararhodobacter oceanensis]|uniref:LysR family transcriptional regulator n=1 Tax=Pararhodobacter oceanensis TaxID=2172121 RepID=UPI003A8CAB63
MPPLTALRAFEAAGRLGGFTPAARELGVTPGAITAHLKTLESTLGVALFTRHPRGVSLTEAGARVLPEFTAAFEALTAAVQSLEAEAAPALVRIATTPDLAQLWLSPRLPVLRDQGFDVVPVPVAAPEAARGQADLVLSFQPVAGAGVPLIAVAAPGISQSDWAQARRLQLAGPLGDWARWAQAAGVAEATRGPVIAQAALALEEAAHGAGVLVIAAPLAAAALAQGRVVQVSPVTAGSGMALRVEALRGLAQGSASARVLAALGAEL